MVASTASPTDPPTWMAVVDMPETRPECSSSTPDTADRVSGTNVMPRPTLSSIIGSITPLTKLLSTVSRLSRSIPAAASKPPVAMTERTPVRTTSLDMTPAAPIMTTVAGRNAAPALNGP